MEAIVKRILKNNLSELRGLMIEGEIPVTEEFINELLQVYLSKSVKVSDTSSESSPSKVNGINFMQIIDGLDKKDIKMELKEKAAVFKISVRKF